MPAIERDYFGDVRDVLTRLPFYDGGHADGYASLDVFTVRVPLLEHYWPQTVFEIGAYRGFFLVTALWTCADITRIGWIDNESHRSMSNTECAVNIVHYCHTVNRPPPDVWFDTEQWRIPEFGDQADLVHIDAKHDYEDCLTDLIWATHLNPRVIFVDDYEAHEPVRRATDEFAQWKDWTVDEYETVNGLAVLTKGG